ncbi:MAG: hypothetical protein ABIL69_11070 [candidate division WOR-3 bacterium]
MEKYVAVSIVLTFQNFEIYSSPFHYSIIVKLWNCRIISRVELVIIIQHSIVLLEFVILTFGQLTKC